MYSEIAKHTSVRKVLNELWCRPLYRNISIPLAEYAIDR